MNFEDEDDVISIKTFSSNPFRLVWSPKYPKRAKWSFKWFFCGTNQPYNLRWHSCKWLEKKLQPNQLNGDLFSWICVWHFGHVSLGINNFLIYVCMYAIRLGEIKWNVCLYVCVTWWMHEIMYMNEWIIWLIECMMYVIQMHET